MTTTLAQNLAETNYFEATTRDEVIGAGSSMCSTRFIPALMHPRFNLFETITTAALGGEKHEQTEDRPDRRLGAAIVENMVFNDQAPAGL